ncbi:peptidyl-prolyl cis-trans isomerase FKBP7 [Erpetoichthys calabaricus]|uniref:peptidylprolyl isomerase n=1 Tax=Erpetoichthys calabaricus TaxID=27687 RepID=A0A8C4X7I0_ERPCA|nr:peptidyl-prolyl cis-trans isomerase FKBP7 [Erpetoichthys calabaricus]
MFSVLSGFLYLQLSSLVLGYVRAQEPTDEVKIEVLYLPEDCPQKTKKGDMVNAHYDGFLAKDGAKFYCSRADDKGHPKWFVLGVGQVIKGLDIGMIGMCQGEKRKVTIPPSLGFGKQGKDNVPPDATLIFEIELYTIARGPRSMEAFHDIDLDNDRNLSRDEIRAYMKREFEKGGKPREQSFYDVIVSDVFQKNDHNRDGIISAKEYNVYDHDEL